LKDLDLLLLNSRLTELHLLRLVAISMFFVHLADSPERISTSSSTPLDPLNSSLLSSLSSIEDSQLENETADMAEAGYRTKVQSLALTVVFKLVAKVASKYAESNASSDKTRRQGAQKMLAMLSTFADWAGHHTVYLTAVEPVDGDIAGDALATSEEEEELTLPAVFGDLGVKPSPSSATSPEAWRAKYRSDKQDFRNEARARSMMKAALGMMKDDLDRDLALHAKGVADILSHVKEGMLLREHAELRGYLPVIHCCEVSKREQVEM